MSQGEIKSRGGAITRRRFLRDASVAGAVAGAAAFPGASAAARVARGLGSGRRVAVLGGGMAGLTVAHELIERGFEVTVYERKSLGGKARSIPVKGTARGGRRELPGEHGFRFFPGFYHHVPDSMSRIPFPGNENGVKDNLVATTGGRFVRANGRADGFLFGIGPDPSEVSTPDGLQRLLVEEILKLRIIPPHEAAFFASRLVVFVTSCDERRYGEWEHTSWWDFVKAEQMSQEYRTVVAQNLTRTVVAAKEKVASTRTIGNMGEAFVMNAMNRGNDGALDRVLDLPTNEAWINPWVRLLRSLGVRFQVGQKVEALDLRGGRVVGARARDRRGRVREIEADWFVSAMPAERARRLLSRDVLTADPSLEGMNDLFVDWMNGIQYYLTKPVDITAGHVAYVDSSWAVTSITQGQFWEDREIARDYGDGKVVDILSCDVSDWDTPGIFNKKPAKRCSPNEVAREVWAQIKTHLQDTDPDLTDDIVHSWFLDPGIKWNATKGRNSNDEPLLVNTIGTWEKRPTAKTEIPNLFMAGDFVQTDIDLATMEGANESGRAAVTALLDAAGSKKAPPKMFRLYDPPEFEAFKAIDRELYKAGQPNAFFVP